MLLYIYNLQQQLQFSYYNNYSLYLLKIKNLNAQLFKFLEDELKILE